MTCPEREQSPGMARGSAPGACVREGLDTSSLPAHTARPPGHRTLRATDSREPLSLPEGAAVQSLAPVLPNHGCEPTHHTAQEAAAVCARTPPPCLEGVAPAAQAAPITTSVSICAPPRPPDLAEPGLCLEGVGADGANYVNQSPDTTTERTALDLCSGCGGMAEAARQSGYTHKALIEIDARCADTLRRNGFTNVINKPLGEVDLSPYQGVDLLTAGLPCQPWSIGGKDTGPRDERNLWPTAISAIKTVKPASIVFEMVQGFLRPKFRGTLNRLLSELEALGYGVGVYAVNTKDYGLAQARRRCLIIGSINGALSGSPSRPSPPITVRDMMQVLGPPGEGASHRHQTHGTAKEYENHKPSKMDAPSKTVVAGCHGPGGGVNTVRLDDGSLRYFTVAEMAELQGFPRAYLFDEVWSHAVHELGNACPPPLLKPWLGALSERQLPLPPHTLFTDHLDTGTDDEGGCQGEDSDDLDLVACTDNSELSGELKVLKQEIERRTQLHYVLRATLSVHQTALAEALRMVRSQEVLDKYLKALAEHLQTIESELGPGEGEAILASIRSGAGDLPAHQKGPVLGDAYIAHLVDSSHSYTSAAAEFNKETKFMNALRLEYTSRVTLGDGSSYAPQMAYAEAVDSAVPEAPEDLPDSPTIYLKWPKRLLDSTEATPECAEANINFFEPAAVMEVSEEARRFQSMKADLLLGSTEEEAVTSSIVDSGAAWCALKQSYLRQHLPSLEAKMQASSLKFKDASGNRMSLVGKVPIEVTIGNRRLKTFTYVFRDLGADFLLGTNALWDNGCVIDCNSKRLYQKGDPDEGVPLMATVCPTCDQAGELLVTSGEWSRHPGCPSHSQAAGEEALRVVCNRDACTLVVSTDGEDVSFPCTRERHPASDAKLVIRQTVEVEPGGTVSLDPRVVGVKPGTLATIEFRPDDGFLASSGLMVDHASAHNPTNPVAVFKVNNPTTSTVTLQRGTVVARGVPFVEEAYVMVGAVLETPPPDEDALRPLDAGGIEDLNKLGLSFAKAIDPEQRLADGSYVPLSEDKKLFLYKIALRWHQVWSRDAKIPKISYLVVIDIPTGDKAPIAQKAYGIPAKLQKPAMDEINKLLKAGLIEPSMSPWASPALVRTKKDSTPEDPKIKFAIDYRRVNACTDLDAGGLGNQADILYGVGGRFKYIGLCDAAGGFYQYMLSPETRHKSAFILPTSMGGTLFQWRVAPYGLTRNPAGYSRGMQWVLKGMHRRDDLAKDSSGGATSWLDDICMKADSFEGFCDLFERVLERLAAAGMTLKGAKCELLHPAMDLLGYVATPHGMMLQKPKLDAILKDGVPSNPDEARKFLGSVAFLRRMIPRVSLLSAPMTDSIKKFEARHKSPKKRKLQPDGQVFLPDEQEDVNQSFRAIVDHLDESAVMSTPDFDDPLAHFVICTDASDFAVGGVLMQWQHKLHRGPGPPPGGEDDPKADPLDSNWRKKMGWELKIIGFYSKTLIEAQRNYPAFDREAGAALLCIRHWADLITYHPTTLYTDSSVATSMLTKHAAPPRLQRWGAELGAFLPHLRIAYRKGADNGLADLLSRFPAFKRFTRTRDDYVELPDDLFDQIGEAPLYARSPCTRKKSYLSKATYKLLEPKDRARAPDGFWLSGHAPEIPGRGMKDRVPSAALSNGGTAYEGVDTVSAMHVSTSRFSDDLWADVARIVAQEIETKSEQAIPELPHFLRSVKIFRATFERAPLVLVLSDSSAVIDAASDEVSAAGCELCTEFSDMHPPDLVVTVGRSQVTAVDAPCVHLECSTDEGLGSVRLAGATYSVLRAEFAPALPPSEPLVGGHAPNLCFRSLVCQAVASILDEELAIDSTPPMLCHVAEVYEHWAVAGGRSPLTHLPGKPGLDADLLSLVPDTPDLCPGTGGDCAGDDTGATQSKGRTYSWQERTGATMDDLPAPIDWTEPTETVTLEHQLRDPRLKLLHRALTGDKRLPRAQRVRAADKYEVRIDGIYHFTIIDGDVIPTIVVPDFMRPAILARYHYSLGEGVGHASGDKMYEQMRRSYYWDGMERECDAFALACETCGGTRSQATIATPVGFAPTSLRPFQTIHVDHKGPLPLNSGYTYVLAVVCSLTRFTLYLPVTGTTGAETLQVLQDRVFSIFGTPLVIISDNGRAFANKLTQAASELFGYRWIYVMPHTPQANGLGEAAVKKYKILLDRHSPGYTDWLSVNYMIQGAVNQARSHSTRTTAFEALFGFQAPQLAALEHPHLLPASTREEKDVQSLALQMSRLHSRLQKDSDDIKELVTLASRQDPILGRRVVPGDKIWLLYSDSERSRYIRKHGHGRPWKHPFTVLEVKPHAVLLDIPRDGSVPEVIPWQSLRKCSFAPDYFHDAALPVPDVNERGLAMTPEQVLPPVAAPALLLPPPSDGGGDDAWTRDTEYEIENIVSARRLAGGWQLQVKWKGYPDPTPEPLSKILKQTNHPDVLADIEKSKAAYLLQHPSEPPSLPESRVVPLNDPSRVQPSRRKQRPDLFAYHVHVGTDELRSADLDMAVRRLSSRPTVRAYLQLVSDDT